MREVLRDVLVVSLELPGHGIHVVAGTGNCQGHEPGALARERGEDGLGVLGRVQVVDHGADDARGVLLRAPLDDGVEVVLPLEHVLHLPAVQADSDHAPVHGESPTGQLVEIDTLVGTVESADPEVDDTVAQVRGVVRGELHRQVGGVVLGVLEDSGQGCGHRAVRHSGSFWKYSEGPLLTRPSVIPA